MNYIERFITRVVLTHFWQMEQRIMTTLQDLQAAVTANGNAVDSAVALINGLKAQLDAAIATNDPAALTALSAQLGQETNALASAVLANTVHAAGPVPVVDPTLPVVDPNAPVAG